MILGLLGFDPTGPGTRDLREVREGRGGIWGDSCGYRSRWGTQFPEVIMSRLWGQKPHLGVLVQVIGATWAYVHSS